MIIFLRTTKRSASVSASLSLDADLYFYSGFRFWGIPMCTHFVRYGDRHSTCAIRDLLSFFSSYCFPRLWQSTRSGKAPKEYPKGIRVRSFLGIFSRGQCIRYQCCSPSAAQWEWCDGCEASTSSAIADSIPPPPPVSVIEVMYHPVR